jgi:DNA-binding LacI/PurR family transcriptional regulator
MRFERPLALDQAGYSLITYTPHPTGEARPLWETLQPDVVMSLTGFTPDQVASIRAAGISAIIPDPDATSEAYVEDGPRLQVEHLVALGHRRVAFAGSRDPRLADLVATRRAAVQATAATVGLGAVPTADIDYTDAAISELIAAWRADSVTAVAAYNDDIAATLVGAALRMGLRLPEDLAVIGHDDTPLDARTAAVDRPRRHRGPGPLHRSPRDQCRHWSPGTRGRAGLHLEPDRSGLHRPLVASRPTRRGHSVVAVAGTALRRSAR